MSQVHMESELLRVELPELSLTPHEPIEKFFEKCERIAEECDWGIDRRRNYAGPNSNSDQLNMHLGAQGPETPMLRMVCPPSCEGRLKVDSVARWSEGRPRYDEYLDSAKAAYRRLFDEYKDRFGRRLRLGVPRTPVFFDPEDVVCGRISYARGKFHNAVRSLATGEGDVRSRLGNAFMTLHVVKPDDLPPPLDAHLGWVYDQLTRFEPRHRHEGSVQATLARIQNSTGAKIGRRIVAISDSLNEVDRKLCNGMEYFG